MWPKTWFLQHPVQAAKVTSTGMTKARRQHK